MELPPEFLVQSPILGNDVWNRDYSTLPPKLYNIHSNIGAMRGSSRRETGSLLAKTLKGKHKSLYVETLS